MIRKLLFFAVLLLGFATNMNAQSASSMKWSNICSGKMPADWYGSEEAQQIADKVLKYQKKSGGWMKNIEFHKDDDTGGANEHSCLDNGATTMEMRFLAKVYQKTLVEKYKESFLKALNMLFTAEKNCGGWSQYWPLKVIKNEYPKWKQRMENQQGTEGFTPQEVKHGLSDNARLYCLQGVQVTSPRKGIYIQNGKKYVVQ